MLTFTVLTLINFGSFRSTLSLLLMVVMAFTFLSTTQNKMTAEKHWVMFIGLFWLTFIPYSSEEAYSLGLVPDLVY